MNKLVTVLIMIFVFVTPVRGMSSSLEAGSPDAEEIDIRNGRVDGKYSDFYFIVPKSWQNFLVAERAISQPKSIIREKIAFYFPNANTAPVFMMSLIVFDNINWNDSYPYTKILETQKYVFATDTAKDNLLENKTERSLFAMFLKNMQSPAFINDLINLPADDMRILKNTITINGVTLNGKTKLVGESIYLPLREICEFIGYRVNYIKESSAISVYNSAGYYRVFMINGGSINEGLRIIIDNDTAYVSNIYFLRDLKLNMDIDDNYNVSMRY